jgi:hypothetical protein
MIMVNMKEELGKLQKETLIDLIEMGHKNFWGLQGNWFLYVEDILSTDDAIRADEVVFAKNCVAQAHRVKNLFKLGDDVQSLITALNFAPILGNFEFEYDKVEENKFELKITKCPMHIWREKQGLSRHPCKPAGLASFDVFIKVINPDFEVRCIACPPDEPLPKGVWCWWEFTLKK